MEVFTGLKWKNGNHAFYILSPEKHSPPGNDSSIVIYAVLGHQKWLFTGDLEASGEERLIKKYPDISVDILKVAHHGSNTSTTMPFLEKIRPTTAIISAGRNNRYNHPHKEVLNNLEQMDIKIYRTDLHGAVTYSFFSEKDAYEND